MSCMNYASRLSKHEYKGPLGEEEYFEDIEEEKKKVKELIEKIRSSEYIVVHSGAGISTSSGLQDFRGPTGIWTNEHLNELKNKKKRNHDYKDNKRKLKSDHIKCRDSLDICSPSFLHNEKKENTLNIIKREKCYNENGVNINACNKSVIHSNHVYVNRDNNSNNNNNLKGNMLENNNNLDHKKNNNNVNNNDNNLYNNMGNPTGYNDNTNNENILIKKECNSENVRNNIPDQVNIKNVIKTDAKEENILDPENYVIFGKRKKKVIELHLALPSKTHIMINELMNKNIIKFMITQNIDSLHHRCGKHFSKTAEIHGNIFTERCDFCGRRYLRDYLISTISFKPTGSLCFLCSFPPIGVCTDVLLDWNNSYEEFFHLNSIKHSQIADFHFCLGSSFYIVPASSYPSKKKYANANSYSCVINYQKSFLSKEVNLNIHSNVNNISDIIIKEFSLNPLSIRSTRVTIVRCPIDTLDVMSDDLISIHNIKLKDKRMREQNIDYTRIRNKDERYNNEKSVKRNMTECLYYNKQGECYEKRKYKLIDEHLISNSEGNKNISNGINISEQKIDNNKSNNNNININSNNNSNNSNYHMGKNINPDFSFVENESNIYDNYKEQTFILKCSMIINIKTVCLENFHKVHIKLLDDIKGIWIIRTNFSCILEVELWYNSFILLKLNFNKSDPFIQLNAWNVNVAYTYGDDIDDFDYFQNDENNKKPFNLYKNKYISNMRTEGDVNNVYTLDNKHLKSNNSNNNYYYYYDKDNSGEPYYCSEILNEHVHVGYNPNNYEPKCKAYILAYLDNSTASDINNNVNNNDFIPFNLTHSLKLLYNIYCVLNKDIEQNKNSTIKETYDKLDYFIKNFDFNRDSCLYTNNFINMLIQNEHPGNQSRYKFRERRKRLLNDYSSCSSDDDKDGKNIFIFYNLYMNQYKKKGHDEINKKDEMHEKNILSESNQHVYNVKIRTDLINHKSVYKTVKNKNLVDINDINLIEKKNNSEELFLINNKDDNSLLSVNNKDNINCITAWQNNKTNCNENMAQMTNNDLIDVMKSETQKQYNCFDKSSINDINNNNSDSNNNDNNNNDNNNGYIYSPVLFINKKYKLGELVYKIPKYVKPQKVYTPYKKITRNKKYSNTLQKDRYEKWKILYEEFFNNENKSYIIDSVLYKEISYFPYWIINYVNDLFECM
ncbi:transcriptional regulatory protein sir2b [Plasmodium sp. gorilla clade G2]|uniref:transcriptional regulatory protein sir2b n=1 Tax=Plasmodium sp. gorilla clade G2 TaxID=880535 RepID=UPI000D21C65C|nr:transcriptional regulatory protein sir2b [Plasmodium sp. gorilla clade G2]SOV19519.1 transcriptional regulatory protein sir2b [Plasmodium sp. gorilla clade G2]